MTLPASGTISLQMIQDEFQAPRGTGLTSLYRGGSYVANTGANAGIPTSGTISITNFYGGTRVGPLAAGSSNVSGSTTSGVSNDLIGNSNITASGGTPPYTYSTAFLSGTSFTLSGGTTASPTFRRTGNPPGGSGAVSGTYRCTVTDSASQVVTTDFTVTDNRT